MHPRAKTKASIRTRDHCVAPSLEPKHLIVYINVQFIFVDMCAHTPDPLWFHLPSPRPVTGSVLSIRVLV